jgi:hypothetical protein
MQADYWRQTRENPVQPASWGAYTSIAFRQKDSSWHQFTVIDTCTFFLFLPTFTSWMNIGLTCVTGSNVFHVAVSFQWRFILFLNMEARLPTHQILYRQTRDLVFSEKKPTGTSEQIKFGEYCCHSALNILFYLLFMNIWFKIGKLWGYAVA